MFLMLLMLNMMNMMNCGQVLCHTFEKVKKKKCWKFYNSFVVLLWVLTCKRKKEEDKEDNDESFREMLVLKVPVERAEKCERKDDPSRWICDIKILSHVSRSFYVRSWSCRCCDYIFLLWLYDMIIATWYANIFL